MISHHHGVVFIHIPKCGGQSIEYLFLKDLGLSWEARAPLLLRPNDRPEIGPPRLAHLCAEDYVRFHYISEGLFRDYYKFTVVRDPLSRVVSLFNYLCLRNANGDKSSFDEFLFGWLPSQFAARDNSVSHSKSRHSSMYYFVRPQVDFVFDKFGVRLVDDVFHLENIARDIVVIKEKCGVEGALPHQNKSSARMTAAQLCDYHVDFIKQLYERDYRMLF